MCEQLSVPSNGLHTIEFANTILHPLATVDECGIASGAQVVVLVEEEHLDGFGNLDGKEEVRCDALWSSWSGNVKATGIYLDSRIHADVE